MNDQVTTLKSTPVEPFLKWAGGKRWFATHHADLIPSFTGRYHEVFLGGGALFFSIQPKKAVLNDVNPELINAYKAIRDSHGLVTDLLNRYQKKHSCEFYYRMRDAQPTSDLARAARFIYLNRTCWNGLYRVNLKGHFNVPIGTKSEVAFPKGTLTSIASVLSGATLSCSDFETVIDRAKAGDLVFADPPYTVNHNLNGFLKYNEKLFSWADQCRLHSSLLRAVRRSVHVVVTNADHESVRKLYSEKEFSLKAVPRRSKISGLSEGRKLITELLITNGM